MKLVLYFEENRNNLIGARDTFYSDFLEKNTWNQKDKTWNPGVLNRLS